jgi:hypothetical protein
MTVASDGRLSWVPAVEAVEPVVLVATNPAGEAELQFAVDVTCERRALGVGCDCGAVDVAPLAWVLTLAATRRRRRKPPTAR